ncbi:HNH endonuclease [Ligilactobacillus murinus]|uniref:HNH endonuclease n=1 Tax=Ligilactobacillus murinus TaxID=1622 RepID=UPI00096F0739|nr:HNH endonuclease signature motif containing protein [Ligilactobacillus murinus]
MKYGYPKGKRPKISKAKRKRIFERCEGRCAYCAKGLELGTFDACIDHVKPLAKGGNNEDENLVMACRKCNASKHDKTLEEWGDYNGESKKTSSE